MSIFPVAGNRAQKRSKDSGRCLGGVLCRPWRRETPPEEKIIWEIVWEIISLPRENLELLSRLFDLYMRRSQNLGRCQGGASGGLRNRELLPKEKNHPRNLPWSSLELLLWGLLSLKQRSKGYRRYLGGISGASRRTEIPPEEKKHLWQLIWRSLKLPPGMSGV